jgi:hypothetical protein
MSTGNKHDSGAAQGARRATEQAPESSPAGGGRWSAKRKMSVVLELLHGADLEATSRKHRVTIATLTQWRDRFLAGGEAGMKSREVDVDDEENRRLKSVVVNTVASPLSYLQQNLFDGCSKPVRQVCSTTCPRPWPVV